MHPFIRPVVNGEGLGNLFEISHFYIFTNCGVQTSHLSSYIRLKGCASECMQWLNVDSALDSEIFENLIDHRTINRECKPLLFINHQHALFCFLMYV